MAALDNKIEGLQQRLTALRQLSTPDAGLMQAVLQEAIDDLQHIRESVDVERAERLRTEHVLRERNSLLRIYVEHTPSAVAIFDRDMRYLLISKRWLRDYRLGEQDVIGRSHYEVFPEIPDRWKDVHRRCLDGATERCDADPFPRLDGTTDWVRWEVQPWYAGDGSIGGIIVFSEVITEQVMAQEALRESESSLKRSQSIAHVGHWMWDTQTNTVMWSDEMYRIFGIDRTAFTGNLDEVINAAIHPDDKGRVLQSNAAVINEQHPEVLDYRVVWSDGTVHHVSAQPGESLCDSAGKIVRLSGIVQDITERKQAEEALRESEARLRLIVEKSPDHIFYQDDTLRYSWSAKLPKDVNIRGLLGKTDFDLFAREEAERLTTIKRRVLQTGIGEYTEGLLNLTDGDYYYEAFYEPRRDANGQVIGLLAYVRNISERKRAEIVEREQRILAEALRDTAASLTSSLDSETVMNRILDNIGRVIPYDAAHILMIEGDSCRVRYWRGTTPDHEAQFKSYRVPLSAPDIQEMLRTGRPILIPDTTTFPGWVNPLVRSHAAVPLRVQNQVIGFLNLDSYQPAFFDAAHAEKLQIFADQAAVAIQNAHLYGQLSDHAARLELRVQQRAAELQQAKEHVEAILNSSSDGIILVNSETGIQRANPAFNALFACSPDAYLNLPLTALVLTEDERRIKNALHTTLTRGTINRLEVRAKRKDGTAFDAEIGLSPVTDGGTALSTVVCILRDVTERKQVQQALAEERNLLRSLIDTIPDFIYVKDLQHRFVLYNTAFTRLSRDGANTFNKTDADFYPPDMAARFHADEAVVFAGNPLVDYEEQSLDIAGNPIWVLTTKVPLRNINGEIIGLVGITRDITARKHNEEALRRSEERWRESQQMLRTVLDSIPVRVFWKDRNSVYLGCNRLFAQDTGLESPEAVVGKSAFDLPVFRDNAAAYVARDRAVMESGTPQLRYEQPIPNVNGAALWAMTSEIPMRDSEGNITGILGIYVDITERKQAEELLRRYAGEVEDLYNNAPCGYHSLDADGVFVRINDTALHWLGYTREEVIGKLRLVDVLTPGSVEMFQASFPQFKARGWVNDREYDWVRKDGSTLSVLMNAVAIYDAEGRYVMDRATAFDITALKQVQDALRESEARFRSYFELPLVGMAVTSPDKGWLQVNDKLCEMLGYSRDELVQKSWVELTHPDDAVLDLEQFEQVLAGQFDGYSLDKRYYRKDGQIIYTSLTTRAVRDMNRQISYFVTLVQDITARKHLEDELRQALDKEKELNELKTRFVSLVSHEFRTPLASIQLASELLQRYHLKMSDEQRRARLAGIQTEIRHMARLLDDVLTISRIERGKLEFNPAPLDVSAFCHDLIDTTQAVTDDHRFDFVFNGDYPIYHMDSELLKHILTNLLNNAVKYSPAGKTVYLSVQCQPDQVVFKVRDEGIGIPPENQPHIFESFYRARNIGQIGGTGLGLAIVKQMVERHGGAVTFESEIGVGTTFTVTIPTGAASPDPDGSNAKLAD